MVFIINSEAANELMVVWDGTTLCTPRISPHRHSQHPECQCGGVGKINIRRCQIYSTPTDEISFITANIINPPPHRSSRAVVLVVAGRSLLALSLGKKNVIPVKRLSISILPEDKQTDRHSIRHSPPTWTLFMNGNLHVPGILTGPTWPK